MKKILFCVLFCLCVCGSGWAATKSVGSTTHSRYIEEETVKDSKTKQESQLNTECGYTKPIRVGGFVTNPPFGWVDVIPGQGKLPDQYRNDGFSFQLFSQIAKNLGLRVSNRGFRSYQDALQALRKGKIDILLGAYYDRHSMGNGVTPIFPGYVKNPIVILFLNEKYKPFSSLEELVGLKGVIRQEEQIYPILYTQFPRGMSVEQVSTSREAYSRLLDGQADYLITSFYAAEAETRRLKVVDKIYIHPTPILTPELFFAVSQQSTCYPIRKYFAKELESLGNQNGVILDILSQETDKWIERFRYEDGLASGSDISDEVEVKQTDVSEVDALVENDKEVTAVAD